MVNSRTRRTANTCVCRVPCWRTSHAEHVFGSFVPAAHVFMLKLLQPALLLGLIVAFMPGCTINRKVSPATPASSISTIYVQRNPNVHMAGLHPEIVQQLTTLGFQVESFDTVRPKEAKHWMTYTANWAWDMAMYLTYFETMLMEEGRVLGRAEYDARLGGGNMGKFGKTAEKIRPLLIELLQNVQRASPSAPALGYPARQAPEPAPTAVGSPAAQESREP